MSNNFQYTFTCEKCGGQFYSKLDPSNWKHTICNACSGKPYKDYPVATAQQTYQPKPVPTSKPVQTYQPKVKQEFDMDKYIDEMLVVYGMIKHKANMATYTIPEESLCAWTTSIMIQKYKMN